MFSRAVATALTIGACAALAGCDQAPDAYQRGGGTGTGGYTLDGTGGSFGSGGQQAGGGAQGAGMPCDVATIVAAKCATCHNTPAIGGAPMPLRTQADFQNVIGDGQLVHARAQVRINAATMAMPPPQQPQLTSEEKATLNAWLQQGAPQSSEACANTGTGGIGGTGGMGTGGTMPPGDADECFEFHAHASGDPNAPFVKPGPPNDVEEYYNFTFKKPWQGNPEALTIRHLIDNTPIVHHTLIYQADGSLTPGVSPSLGIHGADMLLAGWVPGGSDTVLPDDVGLELAGGDFTMEIHYFNNTGAPQEDSTGFEICVTYGEREHRAGVHWLGSEPFGANSLQWTSTCTPDYSKGPITILSSWPHMHLKGQHFTTVINRAGGGQETLYDGDFDFYYQATYPTPAVINQGDTLTTTCQFNAPASFGTRTTDEMCYNFVVAYPAGAFSSGGGLTSGVNHCML